MQRLALTALLLASAACAEMSSIHRVAPLQADPYLAPPRVVVVDQFGRPVQMQQQQPGPARRGTP